MSDKNEQNQHPDYFSRYLQQQLKDHRVRPDKSCWDEIEKQMKKKRLLLYIRRGSYVAGVAILLLLLYFRIPELEEANFIISGAIEEVAKTEVKSDNIIGDIPIADANSLPQPVAKVKRTAITKVKKQNQPKDIELYNDIVTAVTAIEETKEGIPEIKKEDGNLNQTKKKTELPVLTENGLTLPGNSKKKKNWQLGAGLTAMGNLNQYNTDYDIVHDNGDIGSGWIPSPPGYVAEITPDNCDDISYNLPLSIGLTARKELGNRLSIETGLIYTYLSTDLTKNRGNKIKGKLGLHYLGVPVNLIVGLWNNSKWDIYASTGIMVEKGIHSVFKQHIYYSNREETSTIKTSISGLQWSVNGSLGFSYNLHKNWSLYAEPKISYFFDNNQPVSIRTDKPLTLGFGLGVRYNF